MKQKKRIIIVGGMGPQASLLLHQKIITAAGERGAVDGKDFPEIVHLSLAIDDFISEPQKAKVAMKQVNEALKQLNITASDRVVIACNTAHGFLEHLDTPVTKQIMPLMEQAISALGTQAKTVAVLATPTTLQSKLYEDELHKAGHRMVTPTSGEQEVLERAIRDVIGCRQVADHALHAIIQRLKSAGAEAIILGCTELSVIFQHERDMQLIDPLHIMAARLVEG